MLGEEARIGVGPMGEQDWLAEQFEANRPHLHAVAYRMLGSQREADDVVRNVRYRLSGAGIHDRRDVGDWLMTEVARASLDTLRSRQTYRNGGMRMQPLPAAGVAAAGLGLANSAGPSGFGQAGFDPAHFEAIESRLPDAEAFGSESPAMLMILEMLAPAERLTFVLHDLFAMPLEDIAPIVGRTLIAVQQLASRARRRVQGVAMVPGDELVRQKRVVDAFLSSVRDGDLPAMRMLLDPKAVLRADRGAMAMRPSQNMPGVCLLAAAVRGTDAVVDAFPNYAQFAQAALVDGSVGAVWTRDDALRVVFSFTIAQERIVAIDVIADAGRLEEIEWEALS